MKGICICGYTKAEHSGTGLSCPRRGGNYCEAEIMSNQQILDNQLVRTKKAIEYLYRGEHCDDYAVRTITDEVQALYAIACQVVSGVVTPMTPKEKLEETHGRR